MRSARDENLFEKSTMSFGEHLEELRKCLFRALIGLAVGVAIGLFIGGDVVAFIQNPLEKGLRAYYQQESIKRAKDKLSALSDQPYGLPESAADIERLVNQDLLLPDAVYVNPLDVLEQLAHLYPDRFKDLPKVAKPAQPQPVDNNAPQAAPAAGNAAPKAAPLSRGEMVRMFLWRDIKDDNRVRVKTLNAQEAFSIYMKASLVVGAVISSPWVFYQLWIFVAAGLYAHERRYVYVFFPFSLALFLAGVTMVFSVVFERVLAFLFSFNAWMGIEPDPRISEWLSFVLIVPLMFGIGFQLPLVMLFLERIGLFTVKTYLSHWRVSILTLAIVAMILTPPDPYSMMLMFLPLTVLYFGGILLCRSMPRRKGAYNVDVSEE